jgi:flagellar assembly protein FliH
MSTIIKSQSDEPREAVAFAFGDLAERRRAVMEERQRQEAAAHKAAEELRQQQIDARVDARLDGLAAAVRSAVDGIEASRAEWLAHWERSALGVATAIAARVIRREVQRTPEITLDLVREALELASGSAEVQLRMHPDDLAAFGKRVRQLADELGRLGDAKIVADAEITRGGCRVDTRFGSIDQQFEAQLARIELELA